MEAERWLISTADMCEIFEISRRALTNWKNRGCPQQGRGKWFLPDVLKWRTGSLEEVNAIDGESLRARKLQADTEYREERAMRERLLRETLEDLYFRKVDVEEAWSLRALEAKSAFMLFEKTLPMELVGKTENEIEGIIAARVREVLSDYAREGHYTPAPDKSHSKAPRKGKSGVAPAGKAKGKRVGRPKSHIRQQD